MDFKEFQIKSKEYETYVRVFGDIENKTPIIILHGGPGGFMEPYEPLYQLEKYDIPVIIYNQHGSNKSPVFTDDFSKIYTVESFEEELETIINYFHLNRYYLLGHSWGGMLALHFAIFKNPANLKKLILFSSLPSTKMWNEDSLKMAKNCLTDEQFIAVENHYLGKKYDQEVFDEAVKIFLQKHNANATNFEYKMSPETKPQLNKDAYNYMWGPSEIFGSGTLKEFDLTKDLSKLTVPTLIISGIDDESSLRMNNYMRKHIKNSSQVVLHHSAHCGYKSEPKRVIRVITKFLNK